MPAICEKTKPQSFHPWQCQRAAGHDGDCMWPIESAHYNVPLDGREAAWLASEVRSLLFQVESLKKEHRARSARTETQLGALMRGLIKLAPANGTRKNVATAAVRSLIEETSA